MFLLRCWTLFQLSFTIPLHYKLLGICVTDDKITLFIALDHYYLYLFSGNLQWGLTNCKGKIWVFMDSPAIMSSNAITTHCYSQQYCSSLYYLISGLDCYWNFHVRVVSQAFFEAGYLKSKASSYTLCISCLAPTSLVHGKYSCWSVHSGACLVYINLLPVYKVEWSIQFMESGWGRIF